jgi:cytochrome c oxidase cbb3-type subunit 3
MRAKAALVTLAAAALAACGSPHGAGAGGTAGPPRPLPSHAALAAVPLGDLAGNVESRVADEIRNPYQGNAAAVQEGRELFGQMNCAGCHGYDAKGGMGPDLTDAGWRYGGTAAQIFNSIHDGRPKGMPAWDHALPDQEIWKMVAYIQSLGGAQGRLPVDQPVGSTQGDGSAGRSLKGKSGADEQP